MMDLAFTRPWLLWPTLGATLLVLLLGLWAQLRPALSLRVIGQRPWLLGLGAALLVAGIGLGLAEPRWGLPEAPRLTVHVVVDASRSMNVPDADGRARWQAARAFLDKLWQDPMPGVRFSLDVLTGDALPLLPPGEDRTLLRETLAVVQPGDIGSVGTGFAKGLLQVAAQAPPEEPAVILLLSDGEETWEPRDQALERCRAGLGKPKDLPVFTVAFGSPAPQPVAGGAGEPAMSRADADFLARLSELTAGRLLHTPDEAIQVLEGCAAGTHPLPVRRSHRPAHPEWGAWLALAGLTLWALAAGRPLARWRLPLALVLWAAMPAQAQMPQSVKAWMAQRALDSGDLPSARRWRPDGVRPLHRLIAAEVDLRSGAPARALEILGPLTGQGVPRPLPPWRAPALLMAARAQLEAGRPLDAIDLLERLLQEVPGHPEAVHDLQSLLSSNLPPPPPKPPKRPPPPPKRPQGAREDEAEGLRQRLPKRQKPPAGVKDL